MTGTLRRSLAVVVLASIGPLHAHHSISLFDLSTPVWVRGTVVSYEAKNPHVVITLDEGRAGGTVRRWTVEGPILARLGRMKLDAHFLQAGDEISVCGFPYKQDISSRPTVHGHLIVMPQGTRQPWGPYGKLENCIRPDDSPQDWLDFVEKDPMAREYWCRGLSYTKEPSFASRALVDEVNRRRVSPCP